MTLSRRSLTVLGGAAVLAGCAPKADVLSSINIGYQKEGVLLLARSRGVVDTLMRPIRLNWILFPSGPPLLEAMNAGAVDIGQTGDTPPIFAQAAGSALQYVAFEPLSGESEALMVPRGSPIGKVADLKGKRIAFTKASSAHLVVANALAGAGLTLSEVKPTYLAPSDAASAFEHGAVDAWAVWDPFVALAQRDQGARILITAAQLPRTDSFYLASNTVIEHAPQALARLLDALRAEAAWGDANRAEVIRVVSAANGLPPEIVDVSLKRRRFGVEAMDRGAVIRQQAAADTLQDIGVIPRKIHVAEAAWSGWRPSA